MKIKTLKNVKNVVSPARGRSTQNQSSDITPRNERESQAHAPPKNRYLKQDTATVLVCVLFAERASIYRIDCVASFDNQILSLLACEIIDYNMSC